MCLDIPCVSYYRGRPRPCLLATKELYVFPVENWLSVSMANIDSVSLEGLETVLLKNSHSTGSAWHGNAKPGCIPEQGSTEEDGHEPCGHRAQHFCRHGVGAGVCGYWGSLAGQVFIHSLCSELLQSSRRSKVNFSMICAYRQGMWTVDACGTGGDVSSVCVYQAEFCRV